MTTEIATVPEKEPVALTENDVREFIAPNATKKEVFMFLNIAKSYGLNPFKREIHFVKYGDKPGQTIVGYETYLKRAEATGKLDGWSCKVEGDKAKAIIYRKDRKFPFEWEVDRKEFDKKQSTWIAMPNFMLKKVCLAQAFRLCFPEDLGGMPYIPEEIGVDNNTNSPDTGIKSVDVLPPPIDVPKTSTEKPKDDRRTQIRQLCLELNNNDVGKATKYLRDMSGQVRVQFIKDDELEEVYNKVKSDYDKAFPVIEEM